MKNIIAFDLGGSSVKYGILNSLGEILSKGSFPTPNDSFETLLNRMNIILYSMKNFNPKGVSISSPGAVNSLTGVIGGISAIPYIHNFQIKKIFEETFNLPVEIENDGNCSALAEFWLGNGKDFKNIISLVLGSGVGGAVIQNEKLIRGKTFQSGEFGYMLLEGNKTWSSLCSTISLVEKARYLTNIEDLDGVKLFNLKLTDYPEIENLLQNYYLNLSRGIYNLQCAFDSETFIISGGISSNPIFFENLNSHLKTFYESLEDKVEMPFIQKALFENDSNLIGAVYNFIKKHSK
ncbi:ROK family protein [Cetobacterium somerae]|uniref:ROK family protein n=1 Tax=Cetobacterium sp. NK01 TaxID=2993530 RepID=UPI0021160941|nr:ROK family protein [Cetobacterium sp. NK01]MCQ8211026.1 ROK family protein [Cetobacterium sp. NK01]